MYINEEWLRFLAFLGTVVGYSVVTYLIWGPER